MMVRTLTSPLFLLAGLVCLGACGPGDAERPGQPEGGAAVVTAQTPAYAPVAQVMEAFIAHEMETKGIPAISIALVDDQDIVWARGFGVADLDGSFAATPETVYRVGSVSKLFTDLAIMQLWEQGEIDLDAPVTTYLPDFRPENPFGQPVTLRQMMAHHSGLLREPPAGSYFDDAGTTLEEMVQSLNQTTLVYPTEDRFKYSNAAIATVGYVLQVLKGSSFPTYVREAVLEPFGMERSAFEPEPELVADLADAVMWTYDGRTFPAPTFQLGMAPAGSMYSTVTELGRFMSAMFAGGKGPGGEQVVRTETLDTMWSPQFGEDSGTGIGFAIGELEGHRRIGHNGAIYGFATELAMLPEERLGVVAVASLDVTNAVVARIANGALRAMLAVRAGESPEAPLTTDPLPTGLAERLEGTYGDGRQGVELVARGDRLYFHPINGPVRLELRAMGDTLVADDRLAYGVRILPGTDRIDLNGEVLARTQDTKPPEAPSHWRELIGEYGWDHSVLYIFERHGRLHSIIEWLFEYPLDEIGTDRFAFAGDGMYPGEELVFQRGSDGRIQGVTAASVYFPRRDVGTEAGVTFQIDPVRPVAELRAEALAASPPTEAGDFRAPDLVEVTELDPTIRLDIRYASDNNFMGDVFYESPKAFLQRPAAEALVRVHQRLDALGYGLLIYDGYRPWHVTKMFFDATPAEHKIFVADPAAGSRHNRGCAVDLTLYDLATGQPVAMVGGYDEFSPRSYPDYPGGTTLQRWYRELLRDAMEAEGFTVYEAEWWHFDYRDWREYPILNQTFEELTQQGATP